MRLGWVVLTSFVVAGLAAPASAGDGIDVGATATADQLVTCGAGHTYVQTNTVGAPGYTTEKGVITSWSTFARPGDASTVALTVLRPNPGSHLTVIGTTAPRQVTPGRLNTFLTRVPVAAGDDLGLHVSITSATQFGCYYLTNEQFDFVGSALGSQDSSDPTVGASYDVQSTGNRRLNLSAHIEPDADGDGYGDLTQDACPTLVNSHTDCAAPNTFLKGVAPNTVIRHGSTATVKIAFVGSEPATFSCRLDKAKAKPCRRSFKPKAGAGTHTVAVTATDLVGNVDPTPLVVRFSVRRAG